MSVKSYLNTLVVNGTVVAPGSAHGGGSVTLSTHIRRENHLHEHVGGHFVIKVQGEVYTVVKETEVKADVGLLLFFPVNAGVGNTGGTLALSKTGREVLHSGFPSAGTDICITCLTPANADFTAVEADCACKVFQEFLVGETPAGSEGMETCPTVLGTEV